MPLRNDVVGWRGLKFVFWTFDLGTYYLLCWRAVFSVRRLWNFDLQEKITAPSRKTNGASLHFYTGSLSSSTKLLPFRDWLPPILRRSYTWIAFVSGSSPTKEDIGRLWISVSLWRCGREACLLLIFRLGKSNWNFEISSREIKFSQSSLYRSPFFFHFLESDWQWEFHSPAQWRRRSWPWPFPSMSPMKDCAWITTRNWCASWCTRPNDRGVIGSFVFGQVGVLCLYWDRRGEWDKWLVLMGRNFRCRITSRMSCSRSRCRRWWRWLCWPAPWPRTTWAQAIGIRRLASPASSQPSCRGETLPLFDASMILWSIDWMIDWLTDCEG